METGAIPVTSLTMFGLESSAGRQSGDERAHRHGGVGERRHQFGDARGSSSGSSPCTFTTTSQSSDCDFREPVRAGEVVGAGQFHVPAERTHPRRNPKVVGRDNDL